MHRTNGPDFEVVAGKNLFQDTQPLGTVENADARNAVQEEMANFIERSGLTLNDAASDKGAGDFAGATQLGQAIVATDPDFKFQVFEAEIYSPVSAVAANVDLWYSQILGRKFMALILPGTALGNTSNENPIRLQPRGSGAANDPMPDLFRQLGASFFVPWIYAGLAVGYMQVLYSAGVRISFFPAATGGIFPIGTTIQGSMGIYPLHEV